jgi:hypothetical protein
MDLGQRRPGEGGGAGMRCVAERGGGVRMGESGVAPRRPAGESSGARSRG